MSPTSSTCPYKQFNRYIKYMLRDFQKAFPESKIVKLVQVAFMLLKNTARKKPVEFFKKEIIARFEADIEARRLFFLEPTFSVSGFDNIGQNIKETWELADEPLRAQYWEYWTSLLRLAKEC